MSTTSLTPQSTAPSFNTISYHGPEGLKLYSDANSINSSHPSSPESRPVDLKDTIPEEDEDETSSEAANEPLTPTDTHHPHPQTFQNKMNGVEEHDFAVHAETPMILSTPATPPRSAGRDEGAPVPRTPTQKRPGTDGGIKRVVSGFFRRTNSTSSHLATSGNVMTNLDGSAQSHHSGSDLTLGKEQRKMSMRRMSATNSPSTTRTNSPPSPSSPAEPEKQYLSIQEPSEGDFVANNRKKNRSSTGFSLRDRLSRHKQDKETCKPDDHRRHRATSVDLQNLPQDAQSENSEAQLPPRQIWGMAADTGTGLKARRMSLSLPDDFLVDVIELYDEFADQSKLVGRRGKSIGKGATAHVRLMTRKGAYPGELYAVKEFRGKSTNEKAEDYEKKVKSEFSIAKSVHHPNIVETFRLCTYNGRWNHVMEFCDQGDLFGLVSQKYLSRDDHLVDRLCLFKQLVQGLNYLHTNGIAHRDVKLENLLITKDSKLKITDFGVSEVFCGIHPGLRSAGGQCGKEMGEIRLCAPGMCGSPPYVAPEVIAKKGKFPTYNSLHILTAMKGRYDPRPVDVWGAAIVMLCMCANGVLWNEASVSSSSLYSDLVRGWEKWNAKHPSSPSEPNPSITESDYPHVSFFDQHINPPALRRVLLTMLNPDPEKRITMRAVAKNRWLKNVECCQIDSYDDPTVVIDASRSKACTKGMMKVKNHNHLPPSKHLGHSLVRLPGSTDMY